MAIDSSISVSTGVPSVVTIVASGAGSVTAYALQPDCDCSVQFFKADGVTALSGLIHIPAWRLMSEAGYTLLLKSDAGIKLSVVGNTSGRLNGFISFNA